jgi:hypothetical protein
MKHLLFYNCHRHEQEIYYSSKFFNKSSFLKNNFEIHLHCNNTNKTYDELKKLAHFDTDLNITITSKNSGYYAGVAEAHSDNFELFKNYDLVILSQIDCYIIEDIQLQKTLEKNFDILVSPMFHLGKICYAGDFFVIKPKINFLKNWKSLLNNGTSVHEHFLFKSIKEYNLIVEEYDRYSDNDLQPHHNLDLFGLWHEHNNDNIKNYIKEKNL